MATPSENGLGSDSSTRIPGSLSLFGFPRAEASLEARPRSTRWRGLRAAAYWGSSLILAPVVALIPPHVPWIVGVVGVGGFMGTRKWRERYTALSFQGRCPKCGENLSIERGTPVKAVMTIGCDKCHHECRLELETPPSQEKRR